MATKALTQFALSGNKTLIKELIFSKATKSLVILIQLMHALEGKSEFCFPHSLDSVFRWREKNLQIQIYYTRFKRKLATKALTHLP